MVHEGALLSPTLQRLTVLFLLRGAMLADFDPHNNFLLTITFYLILDFLKVILCVHVHAQAHVHICVCVGG